MNQAVDYILKQPDGMTCHDCDTWQQLTLCSPLNQMVGQGIEVQEAKVIVRWRRVTWASSIRAGLGDLCALPLSRGALDKRVPSTPTHSPSIPCVCSQSMSCITTKPSIVLASRQSRSARTSACASDINLVSLPQPPTLFVIYSSASAADLTLVFTSIAASPGPLRTAAHRRPPIPGSNTSAL